jgi:endonuclease III
MAHRLTPSSCAKAKRRLASRVISVLSRHYCLGMLGNKLNPLDEFLYILLSLRTHEVGLRRAYASFKRAFPSWPRACRARVEEIARAIRPAGLEYQKACRIKASLRLVECRFGEVSLRRLRHMPALEAEEALLSLPGVGLKSARCIMMYSLGFRVLPVDVHVARISKRLGLTAAGEQQDVAHYLHMIVPPRLRFAYHVYCVQHGRMICRGQHPKCGVCSISHLCRQIGVPGPRPEMQNESRGTRGQMP